ncbi:MAG: type II toxin-antitoxin system VapC family toxin [Deltaproteobacteria bacterium]|jgi:tRNA(fMet)-specific endonuclease VapC|nr:type II toxin-antitoxin system VapC family toxin [Deltaproteobacteria bacterium]
MYLLDTNILSELVKKKPHPGFIGRLSSEPSEMLYTSSVCVIELRYGSALRDDFDMFWNRIFENIISRITILEFGENEAYTAGDILAQLQKKGQMIGVEDIYIAATAISHNFILVTANIRHYKGIDNLRIENWII